MNRKECDALDVTLCRTLLSLVHKDVKAFRPSVNLTKDAWTYCAFRDNWEFHGPNEFFWYGRASNAYEARHKGWSAWLKQEGADGYVVAA